MALLEIVRLIALIQFAMVIMMIVITLGVKSYIEWHLPIKEKRRRDFLGALRHYPDIRPNELKQLKKHLHMTFTVFMNADKQIINRQSVIQDIFLPQIPQRANSKLWYDRYMAAVFFQFANQYGISSVDLDDVLLIQLIHDRVAIVSIHAVLAAVMAPNARLLNEMITVYQHLRLSQLELLNTLLKRAHLSMNTLIFERLQIEKDSMARTFCYRLLQHLPLVHFKMPFLNQDIDDECLALSLNALAYLNGAKIPHYKAHLKKGLKDKRWQVRARCLKYLGRTQDEALIETIEPLLEDEKWWVRFRAAEALQRLGSFGITILKKHHLSLDEFMQDVAKQRLLDKME